MTNETPNTTDDQQRHVNKVAEILFQMMTGAAPMAMPVAMPSAAADDTAPSHEQANTNFQNTEPEPHPEGSDDELLGFLRGASSWSSFARDIAQQMTLGKPLTERQRRAAEKMMQKVKAKDASRKAAEGAMEGVSFTGLRDAFTRASTGSKLKRLILRAPNLRIKPAKSRRAAAEIGTLFVADDAGRLVGRINESGDLIAVGVGPNAEQRTALKSFADDPSAAARRYGKMMSSCAVCGRALSDEKSVELGIGPVCAKAWGL